MGLSGVTIEGKQATARLRKLRIMQNHNLWAPWRMAYIRRLDPVAEPAKCSSASTAASSEQGLTQTTVVAPVSDCFLCACAAAKNDASLARKRLVLHHDAQGMIVLNRYPYTSGHLLVAPTDHVAQLDALSTSQRSGLMELVVLAQQILRVAYNPQGFNVGINLGRCAGAGLPGHVHVHVVPRWNGDTNFTSVVAGIRVIPQGIDQAYEEMCKAKAWI